MSMQSNGPVVFTLDREEMEVTLETKNPPSSKPCVLREMDGFDRDKYLNSQRGKIERDQSIKDFTDVQTSLIAMCLYDKATDTLVPLAEIRKFPSKMQMKLHQMCMELNGLNMEAETAAKNS